MTRRQLLANMDSRELTEWMAYYQLEPFGHQMSYFMTASHMALHANLQTGRRAKKYIPDDFIPRRRRQQSWQEMKDAMKRAFG